MEYVVCDIGYLFLVQGPWAFYNIGKFASHVSSLLKIKKESFFNLMSVILENYL